jgi:hypothetical protein
MFLSANCPERLAGFIRHGVAGPPGAGARRVSAARRGLSRRDLSLAVRLGDFDLILFLPPLGPEVSDPYGIVKAW